MTSIFKYSRQNIDEQPEEIEPVFKFLKKHKKENLLPPVGIAKSELIQSFLENMEDEEKIRKDIEEAERYEKENIPETIKREVLSHGVRFSEGFFGGIHSFINMFTPLQTFEEETGETETFSGIKLPSAEELHERVKQKTGEYLEPHHEFSKVSQEISSDIGSMFSTPGLGFMQKILLPIGGQLTKQIIKHSGGSEKAQDYGKLGFMTISSIANIGNAPRVASQALNQAENMIPRGIRFSSIPTERAFNRIRNSDWFRSGRTPSKGPAMDEMDRIQAHIQNGSIDSHMAMQLRKDINEARRQLGGFQLNRPVNRRQALRYLDEVDNALLKSMENYGRNVNPQWFHNYILANEAYRITQRSRLISDFIQQHAKPLQSETAKVLFHVAGTSAGLNIPVLAGAAIPAAIGAKSIQIINRMIRSPILRNHYLDVLQQASIGNVAATQKALDKFDRLSKKEEMKFNNNHQEK